LTRRLDLDHYVIGQQVIQHLGVFRRGMRDKITAIQPHTFDNMIFDFHPLYAALLDLVDEIGIVHRLRIGTFRAKIIEDRHQDDGDHYPQDKILRQIIQTGYLNLLMENNTLPSGYCGT
jgi:hypothetical protein